MLGTPGVDQTKEPLRLSSLGDLSRLPFTCADNIRSDPYQFLCVSRDPVARVATLNGYGAIVALIYIHLGNSIDFMECVCY